MSANNNDRVFSANKVEMVSSSCGMGSKSKKDKGSDTTK
jgi:hypothetical protein